MRKLTFLLTFFILAGFAYVQAKEYTIKDIPIVHLQDRTRYVSNPDGILSTAAVATIDSVLYALQQKTGIQTLVVAVTGIEGGDCFDFAHRLGEELGVGQKERDNGLVILLSTDERCIQFATGYGLEGVLPDAISKRIQNRYMLPYFKDDNWDAGMVAGIRAVNGYLDGSMENIGGDEEEDDSLGFIIMFLLIFGGFVGIALFMNWQKNAVQCVRNISCNASLPELSAAAMERKPKKWFIDVPTADIPLNAMSSQEMKTTEVLVAEVRL